MTKITNIAALRDAYFYPSASGDSKWEIRCRDCEQIWSIRLAHTIPPLQVIFKKARRDGWLVNYNKKPRCPKHAVDPVRYRTIKLDVPTAAPIVQPLKMETEMSDQYKSSATVSHLPASQVPMKKMREVMALLDDNFNETTKRYNPGWSDEKIATSTGLHIIQVAKIRSEGYGELGEDPELLKLRDDIASLELQFEEGQKQAKILAGRLEKFFAIRKFGG